MLLVKIKESYLDTVDQGVRNPKALTPLDQNPETSGGTHLPSTAAESSMWMCILIGPEPMGVDLFLFQKVFGRSPYFNTHP